jgi:hypothetical protein
LSKPALVLGILLASLLAIGFAAFSAAGHDGPSVRQHQEEALAASYRCGAGSLHGFLSLELSATGDVFNDDTSLVRTVSVASTPAEACEFHSGVILESLSAEPCTVSAVEVSTDETGETRTFHFVCRAERPTIIRTIAEVSAALLTRSP